MTSLIKHGDHEGAVHTLDWRVHEVDAKDAEPLRDPLIAALEAEIVDLKQALVSARIEQAKAVDETRAQALQEATDAHARDEASALAALQAGIDAAVGDVRRRTQEMDALALLLCHTALEKIFSNAGDYADLVTRAVHHQVAHVRRETILRILVSGADFSDAGALRSLQEQLGAEVISIAIDKTLASGACRIELRLGHIEFAIAEHWSALQAQLRDLTNPSEAP